MELGPTFRALLRHRARLVLVVLEVALTLAIVANCVSLILDARSKMDRKSGFDDENLIRVQSQPFDRDLEEEARLDGAIDADRRALNALPGVVKAANTHFLPWQGGGSSTTVERAERRGEQVRTQFYFVSPEVFDTLGVELVAGRNFTEEEYVRDYDGVHDFNVVVSSALAELLYPGEPALGRVLADSDSDRYHIVGVFTPFYNPYGWPIHEYAMFFPGRNGSFRAWNFLVRAEPGRAGALIPEIEKALLALEPGRNLEVETIPEVKRAFMMDNVILVRALNGVMVMLVFVTALGIVGLTSFSVAERTRQIGTRRALGATQAAILRYFLVENWLVTSLGIALGVVLAIALNVGVVSISADAKLSWGVLAGAVVVLWVLGQLATLGPALRAARIPPAIATRNV
jgi:putative ABC transport system permease protein